MIGGTRHLVNKRSGDSVPEPCSTEASHLFPVAREVFGTLVLGILCLGTPLLACLFSVKNKSYEALVSCNRAACRVAHELRPSSSIYTVSIGKL